MGEVKPGIETFAKIKVCGLGGGGGSAITRMISDHIKGVDFIAINTDIQALGQNPAPTKIAIGKTVTRGLGAGMNPEIGLRAAEENQNEIRNALNGADMVFLTCGLGGGTGTGSIPEVAKVAKELGALTIAVVTKPFSFEGAQRRRIAEEGFEKLSQFVDSIITIPNDRVLQIIDKKTSLVEAFRIVDDVLRQGVQGIAEIITVPSLINVDFADVRAIMSNSGSALMGIGKASGENRAVDAAKQAIASPLLELSIDGAKGILFTITGGENLSMHEVAEAAKVITGSADEDARVIFGANIDPDMKDEIRITVVATGFDSRERRTAAPGVVELQAQGTWTPASPFLRSRDDNSRAQLDDRPPARKILYQPPVAAPRAAPEEPRPRPRLEVRPAPVRMPESPAQEYRHEPPPPPAPKPTVMRPAPAAPVPVEEDDDIEIPAFIRKKMM